MRVQVMPGYRDGGPLSIPSTELGLTGGLAVGDGVGTPGVGDELAVGTFVGTALVIGVGTALFVFVVCIHVNTVTW